ncbi:MAG: Zn-ribbon domain-containing OB-fold protein [bacterium]
MPHGPEAARTWHGTMPVQFRYTPGAAGLRFFQTLKQKGTFAATHCEECQQTYLPPRLYCEECFADLGGAWMEVPPRGRVHSFTLVHADREGSPLREPEIVAFVRIDGTDGGFVARLVNLRPADVHFEMPVEAVLLPPRRRRGTLDDIVGFAPPGAVPARRPRRKSNG